jgi:phosphoribosylaminoimidazole (AIR) synthetase
MASAKRRCSGLEMGRRVAGADHVGGELAIVSQVQIEPSLGVTTGAPGGAEKDALLGGSR